jgi:hypothetical protein
LETVFGTHEVFGAGAVTCHSLGNIKSKSIVITKISAEIDKHNFKPSFISSLSDSSKSYKWHLGHE